MTLKRLLLFATLGLVAAGAFFGIREGMDFTTTRSERGGFGEEARVQRNFTPLERWGERDVSEKRSSEDEIIVDSQTVTFRDTELSQSGNIVVEGTGRLIFSNSMLKMTPGKDDPRANIFVKDQGEIVFESSTLKPHPDDPANLYINLSDDARFVFRDSLGLHMLIAKDNAIIEMSNSTWALSLPSFRGGGVQVRDRVQANIAGSTLGGLILELSEDAGVDIQNFQAGTFEKFNLQEDFRTENVNFNVTLKDSEILGDYYEGGSERGLAVFAPSNIRKLTVSDSTLNKLVITSRDERLVFNGLDLDAANNFSYRNITLFDSTIRAQWGFFMHGGSGHFTDSNGLWFFVHDDAQLTLVDSEMNEFDPRDFTGIIDFDNVVWKNAGEIIGNNDFTWKGEWVAQGFRSKDFHPLLWDDSRVRRTFSLDAISYEPEAAFVEAARLQIQDADNATLEETYTDKNGRAYFSIVFDDTNYAKEFIVKVIKGDKETERVVNFLTPTPIKLILK